MSTLIRKNAVDIKVLVEMLTIMYKGLSLDDIPNKRRIFSKKSLILAFYESFYQMIRRFIGSRLECAAVFNRDEYKSCVEQFVYYKVDLLVAKSLKIRF